MPNSVVMPWESLTEPADTDLVYVQRDSTMACRQPRAVVWDAEGRSWPVRCNRGDCPGCVSWRAWRLALAIAWSEPTHMLTLTCTGKAPSQIKRGIDRLTKRLRDRGYAVQWLYVVEPNSSGLTHVHLLMHGRLPTGPALMDILHGLGFAPRRQFERLLSPAATAQYVLKALRAAGASAQDYQRAVQVRALNGGLMVHASRGFYRDQNGAVVSRRQAQKQSLHAWRGQEYTSAVA